MEPRTNTFTITTNRIDAPSNFRIVTNWVFNTETSKLWENVTGTIQSKHDGVMIVETYEVRKRPSSGGGGHVTGNQRIGGYIGGANVQATEKYKDYGKTIAITNVPDYAKLTDGQDIDTDLMRVGVYESEGRSLELWDRGTLYRPMIIKTNRAAATALKARP